MIPSDLALQHSSSNIKMSQREKDELAEQWYAMMIKEDADVDVNSQLSALTQSVGSVASSRESSRDDLQEQRDPNNRAYQRRRAQGERLLDKAAQFRENSDEYQYRQGVSKSNSKTDFLDGIIQSLSELSKGDDKEAKSILQEKKNGWSIHDSQRRMQERRSQRQMHEQKANGGVSSSYQQQSYGDYENRRSKSAGRQHQSHGEYENRRGKSADRRRDRDEPIVTGRRSLSRHRDRMFEESDGSQVSTHRNETYSFRHNREEPYSSGNSRSETYYSGNSRSNSRSTSRSRASSRSMPMAGDPASYSFRKDRSWNIDKSLKRSAEKSLFDVPISPESNRTPEEPEMILPLDSTSSFGSDRFPFEHEPVRRRKSVSRNKRAPSQASTSSSRTAASRDQRTPSLASSSSRDAGKILQHFALPVSCAPVNGAVGREGVENFFEASGESYPSRPRSNSSKRGNRSSSKSRRSYEQFPAVSEEKIPKTRSQKKLEGEILQKMEREPPIARERRRSREGARLQQHTLQQQTRNDESRTDDFEAIWGESDGHRDPAPKQNSNSLPNEGARFSIGGTQITAPEFSTNFAPNSVLSQFTSCNATGHGSSPKMSETNSLGMFEKIQQQLNNRSASKAKIDSTGFPMKKSSDTNKNNEQDQRIQEKLDAVRARSMRNAQIVQQMESGEQLSTAGRSNDTPQFNPFGSEKKNLNSSKASEAETSNNSNFLGMRLDKIFDINTDVLEDLKTRTDANKKPTEKHPLSSAEKRRLSSSSDEMKVATPSSAQKNIQDNEISHYMYVAYSQFGDDARKVLKLCGHHTLPTPDRRKGEILVRVHASTVSHTDCAIRRGEWKNMSMDPYVIPGVALVGKTMGREKKKRHPSSSCIEPGDNVLTLVRSGANARYMCLQKNLLIKVPPKLQPERAVCLVETYLTAFQALHLGQRGGMRYRDNCLQGQSILIMNAYTPLGKAIIELARLGGASICYGLVGDDLNDGELGYSSSDMHQRYKSVENWGAIPLSSDPQDWLTLIGRQIDMLITSYDPHRGDKRGSGQITADHWKALKKEGQVHAICSHPGMSELEQRNLILGSQSSNNKAMDMKAFRLPSCRPGGREKMADRTIFYNLFDSWEGDRHSKATARKDLEHLIRLLDANLIHPEIADRLPLSKIAKAQRSLDLNKVTGAGHLICSPWLREKPKEEQHQKKTPDAMKYVV